MNETPAKHNDLQDDLAAYVRTLQRIQDTVHQLSADSHRAYNVAIQSGVADSRYEEAVKTYAEEMRMGSSELGHDSGRADRARRDFADASLDAQSIYERTLADALTRYLDSMHSIWVGAADEAQRAFPEFLQAFKKRWEQLEIDMGNPLQMVEVAQILYAAAVLGIHVSHACERLRAGAENCRLTGGVTDTVGVKDNANDLVSAP